LLSLNVVDELSIQQIIDNLPKKSSNQYDEDPIFSFQFDDTKFPILTFVAVLLVLAFLLFNFYKFKTRKRIKRSLYYTNDFQRMNNKRSTFNRNSSKSVTKYNSRLLSNFI
jgi:hypothetical protein